MYHANVCRYFRTILHRSFMDLNTLLLLDPRSDTSRKITPGPPSNNHIYSKWFEQVCAAAKRCQFRRSAGLSSASANMISHRSSPLQVCANSFGADVTDVWSNFQPRTQIWQSVVPQQCCLLRRRRSASVLFRHPSVSHLLQFCFGSSQDQEQRIDPNTQTPQSPCKLPKRALQLVIPST